MEKRIIENQSALDVVAQNYGSLEAAFSFLLKNELSITDDLFSNQIVEVETDSLETIDESIIDYFSSKKIKLATGFPLIDNEPIGIGVMVVGDTFIVK